VRDTLSIGEVAGAVGLKTSAVRYYERVGVLPPAERVSGQRRYARETIDQLRAIRAAQQAGLTLDEIGRLLRGNEEGHAGDELRALAERKLPEVDALIERAEAMRRWLELAAECRCSTLEVCELFREDSAPPTPLRRVSAGAR
jgi:MerR family redox-sensitive transcriptional activator SoxR